MPDRDLSTEIASTAGVSECACGYRTSVTNLPRAAQYDMCLHRPDHDIYVSQLIHRGEMFDSHVYESVARVHAYWSHTYASKASEPLFVDVGGNVGTFTLFAAALGFRTFTFEPLQSNYGLMWQALRMNDFKRSKLYSAALSSGPGAVDLYMFEGNYGSTFMPSSGTDPRVNAKGVRYEGSSVTVRMEDVLGNELGERMVELLKIDCEGAEALVLLGAATLIRSRRFRSVIIEVQNLPERKEQARRAFRLFREAGYHVHRVHQSAEGTRARLVPARGGADACAGV